MAICIGVPAKKNLGCNEVLPKFCDIYPNYDFLAFYGLDKRIVGDSRTKAKFRPKNMVFSKKKRLNLVIIFSIYNCRCPKIHDFAQIFYIAGRKF